MRKTICKIHHLKRLHVGSIRQGRAIKIHPLKRINVGNERPAKKLFAKSTPSSAYMWEVYNSEKLSIQSTPSSGYMWEVSDREGLFVKSHALKRLHVGSVRQGKTRGKYTPARDYLKIHSLKRLHVGSILIYPYPQTPQLSILNPDNPCCGALFPERSDLCSEPNASRCAPSSESRCYHLAGTYEGSVKMGGFQQSGVPFGSYCKTDSSIWGLYWDH